MYKIYCYLPMYEAMAEVGQEEVETYAARFHNTVEKYIVTCPIMYLCMEADQLPVAVVSKRWW